MTPFQDIYDLFYSKITSYDLFSLSDLEINEIAKKYLDSSISRFVHCEKDLEDREDALEQFNVDLTMLEKEILSLNMVYVWLNSYVQSEEFLKQHLGSKDYQVYSPANHLAQLIELRTSIQNEIDGLINLYYYASYGE